MTCPPCRSALRAIALAAVAAALLHSPAHAGAWTRPEGSTFVKLGYDRWFTAERFDSQGRRVPYLETQPGFDDEDQFRSHSLRGYVEHGITSEWTAAVSASLEHVEIEGNGRIDRTTGVSDVRLQIKRLVVASPLVVSVFGEGKVPGLYDSGRFPALGTGTTDFGWFVALGGSKAAFYATAEAGYLARGNRFSNEVPFAFEAGWSVRDDVMLRTEWRGATTVRDLRVAGGTFDPALADSRWLTGGLSVVLSGEVLDIVAGVDQVVAGRNTLAGTRLSVSVWWER